MDLFKDIDLCTVALKGKAKKLDGELKDYRARILELHRTPVLRLRRDDYLFMRATAARLAKVDKFRDLLLDGEVICSAAD